ncbi:MAG: HesB/IscA family protein [Hyphomicrobiaceae bacterium]
MSTTRARPAVMTLTDAAVQRLKAMMAQKGEDVVGLRIGVKKGGCAGMEYAMSWVNAVDKLDEVVERDGARVVIDSMAVLYLLGTEMDYHTDKLSSGFVFRNPNQKSACGCGESVELVPAATDKLQALKQ